MAKRMTKKLSIEIANTPSLLSKGLMYRKNLPRNSGMLFKFPRRDYLSFWMKSTYIPLDIAFLEDDGTIFQISEMYPLSTRTVSSQRPCKMALEVNQGWFDRNRVGVGDKIKGIEKANPQYKIAQQMNAPPDGFDNENVQKDQDAETEIQNPAVELILEDREKVRNAEKNNLNMQIIYHSKGSGQTLPPRRLMPIPGEGYPIRVGEGGEYFVAFDASPTINGDGWVIEGNQIKRFLFSNIIALEVVDEFAQKEQFTPTETNSSQIQKGFLRYF